MKPSEPNPNADAALYALDALEADEREQFEQALLDSGELEQAVDDLKETTAALAYGAPSVPMAADLKARLFERIEAECVGPSSDLVKLLDLPMAELKRQALELSWSSMPGDSGAEIATWQVDEPEREVAFFVRNAGGCVFPNHAHASGETVLVLEGDFVVGDQVYRTGEQVSCPGNTSHQPETRNGCLLFCVSSMDDDILDV